jgi:hypothetical protein
MTKKKIAEPVVPELDLPKKVETTVAAPVPEKTLSRKWIEHMAKQVKLNENLLIQTDATLLKLVSDQIEILQGDLKEFNELKAAVKTVNRFTLRHGGGGGFFYPPSPFYKG